MRHEEAVDMTMTLKSSEEIFWPQSLSLPSLTPWLKNFPSSMFYASESHLFTLEVDFIPLYFQVSPSLSVMDHSKVEGNFLIVALSSEQQTLTDPWEDRRVVPTYVP